MVDRLPIDYVLNARTRHLFARTVKSAIDHYGTESVHYATAYTPDVMRAICREFDEVWQAFEKHRDEPTPDHRAHLREELAQLATLCMSAVDASGPTENRRWWMGPRG